MGIKLQVVGRAKKRLNFSDMLSHAISAMGAVILVYFAYYAFVADKNLFSLVKLDRKIAEKQTELDVLTAEHENLDRKTRALYPKSLDKDMLDEKARQQLGLIGRNELMVFIDKR